MNKCIVLANGHAPKKNIFIYLKNVRYDTLICADGGANSAYKLKIDPDYIIGDLDSILPEVLNFYKDRSIIIKHSRQTDTDVEKCLKFAVRKKFSEVILLGGTGDRLDHSFCNLGIVLKFFDKIRIKILHQKSVLYAFDKDVNLETIPGEIISIYGFDEKTKISSTGLRYPLINSTLPFGKKESTSNSATGKIVKLKIKGGKVFVVREFDKLRKHGYFQHT